MSEYNIGIDCVKTAGWDMALHGMRNPAESWESADSTFHSEEIHSNTIKQYWTETPIIGPNDLKRLLILIRNGREHRKTLRQICVWFNITLPIYLWSEFDTYKIGVTRNSCSTMYKLGHKPLTYKDFSYNDVNTSVLDELNKLGELLREARSEKDKKIETYCLKIMKRELPSGYLQKATISCNYEVLLNMFYQRANHRLDEWNNKEDNGVYSITNMIEDLPYMKLLIEAKSKKGRRIKELVESVLR